jgi:hypothetical protein
MSSVLRLSKPAAASPRKGAGRRTSLQPPPDDFLHDFVRARMEVMHQTAGPRIGMTLNPGGFPRQNVCSIPIVGLHGA